jgi:WD40 repeat protein
MTVSPGEEYLTVACKNNNIGLIPIKSIGLNEDLHREIKFDLICKGFHSGSITGIDVAIQRPILVTCSRDDSTVRIWNYMTYTCELAREFFCLEDMAIREAAKPLLSVAIHPAGYYLAISFIDKIRIYHILHDELRHYKNIEVKNC